MAFSFSRIKNWNAGETLTAADLNGEFDNILANATPASIGAQTLDATLTALAALTLTQGGIFTASGADTPVVLAKGTASQTLVMNAGATAPEWGTCFEVVSGTRDVSLDTDLDITGAGFTPTAAILAIGSSGGMIGSIGFCDTSGEAGGIVFYPDTTMKVYNPSSFGMYYVDGSNHIIFSWKAWSADGMTIQFSKTGSPTGTAIYQILFMR